MHIYTLKDVLDTSLDAYIHVSKRVRHAFVCIYTRLKVCQICLWMPIYTFKSVSDTFKDVSDTPLNVSDTSLDAYIHILKHLRHVFNLSFRRKLLYHVDARSDAKVSYGMTT
jgi:hypothetical protein